MVDEPQRAFRVDQDVSLVAVDVRDERVEDVQAVLLEVPPFNVRRIGGFLQEPGDLISVEEEGVVAVMGVDRGAHGVDAGALQDPHELGLLVGVEAHVGVDREHEVSLVGALVEQVGE
mgnify:CR=1 FL=1